MKPIDQVLTSERQTAFWLVVEATTKVGIMPVTRRIQLLVPSLFLFVGIANAQPISVWLPTIEAEIAKAEHVVLATISDLSRNVIVPPGGKDQYGSTDPNGRVEYIVAMNVNEVIKGNVGDRLTDLRGVHALGFDKRFEQWTAARTVFLCYLDSDPKPGKRRGWRYHPLGKPVEQMKRFGQGQIAPMLAQDLSILKTEAEVLSRARAYAAINRPDHPVGAPATMTVRLYCDTVRQLSNGAQLTNVEFAIDSSLETIAHRLIKSPEEFLSKEALHDDLSNYAHRIAGVQCLRFFTSDTNATLLRELLEIPPETFESDTNFKPIRIQALQTLLGWGLPMKPPKFADDITVLDLARSNITDETLGLVGQLKNLTKLDLSGTNITSDGLIQLDGLKKMSMLELSNNQLNDANLRTINEIGMLHLISAATTTADKRRPRSAEDVGSLSLWQSPITDAGLKEFAEFRNVVYLDLRNTAVTDAGLDHLSHMKKVRWLHLDQSRITDAGIQKLAGFPALEVLGLGELPVTDAGLNHLTGLSKLTGLRLNGTTVTEAGITRLQQALPACRISRQSRL